MEEKKLNLFQKIVKIRVMFAEKKIQKSGKNQYAGFDYFELEDILKESLPLCSEVGVCPITTFEDGYAIMTVYDVDSDAKIQIKSPLAECNLKGCHPIQNMGSVESYSRRYLWMAFLEVKESDALDMTSGKDEPQRASQRSAITTRPPREANKDTRPAETVKPESLSDKVWKACLRYFGYSKELTDAEKQEVRNDAKKFLKESYQITQLSEITDEIGAEIMDFFKRTENKIDEAWGA